MCEWCKSQPEMMLHHSKVITRQGPRRRMEKTSWTAHLITKHQLFTWHLFKGAQKKRCTGRQAFSQYLSLQNWFYLVVVLIPCRSMRALLTQFTTYSNKNSQFFPTQSLIFRWKVFLQADVRNSMDWEETSAAVLYVQLFNHIANNTKLSAFQSLVLRHNTYCIHLEKWVTWFLGTGNRFLLSLLPKENSKKKKITLPEIPLLQKTLLRCYHNFYFKEIKKAL